MSLLNKANATPAPTTTDTGGFEQMDDATSSTAQAAVSTSADAAAPAAAPAASPAPAPAPAAAAPAVNLGSAATANVANTVGNAAALIVPPADKLPALLPTKRVIRSAFEDRKNAIEVDYNTLTQLFPNNGNVVDRETTKMLGDTIVFTFLSYQDTFVVSPEDDNAPDEVVRYSDDGVICSDGTPVEEHLQWLQDNGFPKARLKNRNIVVGLIEESPKLREYEGKLVQIDLPPSSKVMWDRYGMEALYAVKTERMTQEQADRVRMTINVTKKKENIFSQAHFEAAHLKAAA